MALANDVLLVSKILLGYEKTLWSKKLDISHAIVRFWFFLSYLITTVHKMFHCAESKVGRTMGGGELPKQQTKTYCYFYWHNRFFAPKSPEAASTAPL